MSATEISETACQVDWIDRPVEGVRFTLGSGRSICLSGTRALDRISTVSSLSKHLRQVPPLQDLLEWIELTPSDEPRVGFRITGYTHRTTVQFLQQLSGSEQLALLEAINTPEVYGLIETAAKTRAEAVRKTHELSIEVPLHCYSTLKLWVSLQTGRATAAQWIGRMRKCPGIRGDELHWCGALDWLTSLPLSAPVEMQALVQHFDYAPVMPVLYRLVGDRVPELGLLEYCDRPLTRAERKRLPQMGEAARVVLRHPAFNYRVIKVQHNDLLVQKPCWLVIDDQGHPILPGPKVTDERLSQALRQLDIAIEHRLRSRALFANQAKWDNYTTPSSSSSSREYLLALDSFPHRFKDNPHYARDNVLLHLRTSIQSTLAGRRILVVEELQSDWLQKRNDNQHLYSDTNGNQLKMPWLNHWYELGILVACQIAINERCDGLSLTTGDIHRGHYGHYFDSGGMRFYDQILPKTLQALASDWRAASVEVDLVGKGHTAVIVRHCARYALLSAEGTVIADHIVSEAHAEKLLAQYQLVEEIKLPAMMFPRAFINHIKNYGIPLFGQMKPFLS